MKILVTGNAGSGKSSFGQKLSEELNIPLYGLDKVVWKSGWQKTPLDERRKLMQEIIVKPKWIIEGVSKDALSNAEKVYFLDISTTRCILNIIKRFIKNGFGTREELPINCPEYIGVFKAIRIALIFRKVTRPWIIASEHPNLIQINNYSEITRILNEDL